MVKMDWIFLPVKTFYITNVDDICLATQSHFFSELECSLSLLMFHAWPVTADSGI